MADLYSKIPGDPAYQQNRLEILDEL